MVLPVGKENSEYHDEDDHIIGNDHTHWYEEGEKHGLFLEPAPFAQKIHFTLKSILYYRPIYNKRSYTFSFLQRILIYNHLLYFKP